MSNVENIELHPSAWGNAGPIDSHAYAYKWYNNTIFEDMLSVGYNDQYNNYSAPYLEQSINFLNPDNEYVLNPKTNTEDVKDQSIKMGSAWWRPDQIILSLSDVSAIYTNGNVCWDITQSTPALIGLTSSPVFISSNLKLPMDAKYLSFDLQVMQWNPGDIFAVYWNETSLMSFFTDALLLNEWYNFPDIDMYNWLGTNGTLTFAYFTEQDGIHSMFGLRNIGFYYDTETSSVPEPSTVLLLGLGLIVMAGFRIKFKK